MSLLRAITTSRPQALFLIVFNLTSHFFLVTGSGRPFSGFKLQLRKVPQLLASLRTPEDSPIPPNTLDEMQRDLVRLALIREQIKAIEQARLARLEKALQTGPNTMIRMLASIRGVSIETAEMLVQEVLSRHLRDRRAVGRYAGLTGAPRPDPARLALPLVPEGQRSGAVVPEPDRGCQRGAQEEDDRRSCPQAAHRALAHGHHRRSAARRRAARRGLTSLTDKERKHKFRHTLRGFVLPGAPPRRNRLSDPTTESVIVDRRVNSKCKSP